MDDKNFADLVSSLSLCNTFMSDFDYYTITYFCTSFSLSYFNWVPFFMDPNYNRTQALRPTGEKIKYEVFSSVPDFVSESLVVNCLGAAMVALVVIMPILVLSDNVLLPFFG